MSAKFEIPSAGQTDNMIYKAIFAVISMAFLGMSAAAEEPDSTVSTGTGLKEVQIGPPFDMDNGGSFQYNVPIEVPTYRGLEPRLSLSYDSARRSNGSPDAILGVGWQLSGLSMITRNSLGGGAPTFDADVDIFRLDGMDLLACTKSGFDWPYGWAYPSERRADRKNASCSYGNNPDGSNSAGNMTLLKEDYRRIRTMITDVNGLRARRFVIRDTSGKIYTYLSPGEISDMAPEAGSDAYQIMFNRTWLLTTVQDTQDEANSVRYYYAFDRSNGWAHRLTRVSYGKFNADGVASTSNYNVYFLYVERNAPLATYALGNGLSAMGAQYYSLYDIVVKDGGSSVTTGNNIRGYAVRYTRSPEMDRLLVDEIRQFGSELSLNADGTRIAAAAEPDLDGIELPGWKFQYNSDALKFAWPNGKVFEGARFAPSGTIADLDNDGKDEAIFNRIESSVYAPDNPNANVHGQIVFSAPRGAYETKIEDSGIDLASLAAREPWASLPLVGTTVSRPPGAAWPKIVRRTNFGIVTHWENQGSGVYVPTEKSALTLVSTSASSVPSPPAVVFSPLTFEGASQTTQLVINTNVGCHLRGGYTPLLGNFEDDPGLEIYYAEAFYNITTSGLSVISGIYGDLAQYCDGRTFVGNEWAADINGDGVDEIINNDRIFVRENGRFKKYAMPNFPLPCAQREGNGAPCQNVVDQNGWSNSVLFGDVNGDGMSDGVIIRRKAGEFDWVQVAISTGYGFKNPVNWIYNDPALDSYNELQQLKDQLADMNGDGLADLIWHAGSPGGSNYGGTSGPPVDGLSGSARIYFSDGRKFSMFTRTDPGFGNYCDGARDNKFCIESLIGTGDMDGDGLTDVVSGVGVPGADPAARIYFNRTGTSFAMQSVKEPIGRTTEISYGIAERVDDNQLPRVQRVVKVLREFGLETDIARVTRFDYFGARYNYTFSRPMGYLKIIKTLPIVAGEDAAPTQTIEYSPKIWTAGLPIATQLRDGNGVLMSETAISYERSPVGEGLPFKTWKSGEVAGTRFGAGSLVYTRKGFNWDAFGQNTIEIDFGLQSGSGIRALSDVTKSDDIWVWTDYNSVLDKYIMNLPKKRVVLDGSSIPYDNRNNPDSLAPTQWWLSAERFFFDGLSAPPPAFGNGGFAGNMTGRDVWSGSASAYRPVERFEFDASGNITAQQDALAIQGNYVSLTHVYDTAKKLFRLKTTNALSQETTLSWSTRCQAPNSVTDINGLVTTTVFDAFCREIRQSLPNGREILKQYMNLGQVAFQHIKTTSQRAETPPPGTIDQSLDSPTTITWEYFDGFGQAYRTAHSATGGGMAKAIVYLKRFDNRGNLRDESLAFDSADFIADSGYLSAIDWVASIPRKTYTYDTLGRLVEARAADGAKTTTTYGRGYGAPTDISFYYAAVFTKGPDCYDARPATLCAEQRVYTDGRGLTTRKSHADIDGGTASLVTDYSYDKLGRLVGIKDPVNALWAYTYDHFGNRTLSDDPGLGLWTLTYDFNGNLLNQTDASGNTIVFAYDRLGRVQTKTVSRNVDGILSPEARTVFAYDTTLAFGGIGYNKGQLTREQVFAPGASASLDRLIHQVDRAYAISGGVQHEQHWLEGNKTYSFANSYTTTGAPLAADLPLAMGDTPNSLGNYRYDNAGRVIAYGPFIPQITYNADSNPIETRFANGMVEILQWDDARGWLDSIQVAKTGLPAFSASYLRSPAGRLLQQETTAHVPGQAGPIQDRYAYAYDFVGRLVGSQNSLNPGQSQSFGYDRGGRLTYKGAALSGSLPQTYSYGPAAPDHAPTSVEVNGITQAFTYDPNGNMTAGLNKAMTYDGENRPLSVTFNGQTTCYVYGASGVRLKKIELKAFGTCTAPGPQTEVTAYVGPLELRNFGTVAEEWLAYPHPLVRLVRKNGAWATSFLHTDYLGSVRAISDASGTVSEGASYQPYGEQSQIVVPGTDPDDSKGWIGERYDADAGLQYLNARYYDPVLGMFLQPDWFEVMEPGVGTNRYGYSAGDPVNKMDPGGNQEGPAVDPDDWDPETNPPSDSGLSYSEQMSNVGDATYNISVTVAYEASPVSAYYDGVDAWNAGSAIGVGVAVASVFPIGKVTKVTKLGKAASHADEATKVAKVAPDGNYYSVGYETKLDASSYPGTSRAGHFQEANEKLLKDMESDPKFADTMADAGVIIERTPTGLAPRQSPTGWTWHHDESPGTMQLVPREQHAPGSAFQRVLHPDGKGGFAIWGK
ncbi:RHS repeat-associated core domain-containing protein [Neogemmobacter tilapiae]|uniref:Insecticide toxin TcdB middle/N-terminal domain-containing protein n=1 Tax=Neogemmobacter tilapiae TaxID=875041 RepID=A0A918TNX1_9RHOB|nr:RHS repeat-associated core domain-containing protein [Gemmobacter tilapiae]GHC56738.1 hypothetical protein GCM10007315_20150 [Gemmobacter tilapiae]